MATRFDWQIESMRATAIGLDSALDREQAFDVWQVLFESDPDRTVDDKRAQQLILESASEGPRVMLICKPNRLQLQCLPNEEMEQFPLIGSWASRTAFINQCREFVKHLPEIKRIAFGAVLHLSVSNKAEATSAMAQLLNRFPIEPDTSDWLIQFNKPTKAKTSANIEINRLSNWSIVEMTVERANEGGVIDTKEFKTLRLAIDVNNKPDDVSTGNQGVLFDECVSWAESIAEEGQKCLT